MPAVRLPGSNDMRALTVLSVSLLPVPWIRMALLVMTRPSMSCKLRECLKTNVKDLSDRLQGSLGQGRKRQGLCG